MRKSFNPGFSHNVRIFAGITENASLFYTADENAVNAVFKRRRLCIFPGKIRFKTFLFATNKIPLKQYCVK